jgi:hypothetical protein
MACVTLKRSFHELNTLEPSPKRRRCGGPALAPSTPPEIMAQPQPSSFSRVTPKVNSEQLSLSIHSEWKRMARRRKLLSSHDGHLSPTVQPSPLFAASSSSSSITSPGPVSPSSSCNPQAIVQRSKDQPLFTLRQVTMIVERLWKEREEQVREEYDRVLSDKLAEQYEAFVRFNRDYLQRRFSGDSISCEC